MQQQAHSDVSAAAAPSDMQPAAAVGTSGAAAGAAATPAAEPVVLHPYGTPGRAVLHLDVDAMFAQV